MMEHGEIKMPRKQMARLMGRVFIQKSEVNLLSSVLDTPEFFWRAPDALQALTGRYELLSMVLDTPGFFLWRAPDALQAL
eukprot:923636-Pelagomonas_calceolata.AAC.1